MPSSLTSSRLQGWSLTLTEKFNEKKKSLFLALLCSYLDFYTLLIYKFSIEVNIAVMKISHILQKWSNLTYKKLTVIIVYNFIEYL